MSDTPRTDAEAHRVDHGPKWYEEVVSADFARQLERELAAERASRAALLEARPEAAITAGNLRIVANGLSAEHLLIEAQFCNGGAATIEYLAAQLAEKEAECERLKEHAEKMANAGMLMKQAIQHFTRLGYAAPEFDDYRRDFPEGT